MILFGTGGWRAEIGSDFVLSNIKLVAQGISDLIKSENKTDKPIIVGYDRRFLSKEASVWLCEVFSANINFIFLIKPLQHAWPSGSPLNIS